MTLDWLNDKPNIIRANLSLSGFYTNGKKDVLQFVSNAYLGNDEYTINSNPAFRQTGMGMWTHKIKNKVSYQVGWAYSYMFGLGIALPVVGVTVNPTKKSTLNINFPYGITYKYFVNDHFSNRLYMRPNGNVANLTNQFGEFHTRADEVVLRQSEYRAGWQGRYKLNQWVVSADVSYSFYRHLFASERSTGNSVNYAASILKPVTVFSIGIVYNFKNLKKKNQLNINELDLNNLEPEDILNAQ